MKKILLTLLTVGVLVAIIAGIAIYVQLQRSYREGEGIESRSVSAQSLRNEWRVKSEEWREIVSWEFTKVDPIHWARWEVHVSQSGDDVFISFASDFEAADGPDLYVHLSGPQEYGGAKWATIENTLNLGRIVSKDGEQVYRVSLEEWEKYNHSILIWCRAFGIHFSHAILK